MKGVKYRPMSSGKMLGRNMMIYGLGGIIAPFVGIKIIDLIIVRCWLPSALVCKEEPE